MGNMQKTKGKVGERELAAKLTELGFPSRRGCQYSGLEGRDVVGPQGVHIECKRTEALRLGPAMEQAIRDAADGEIPIVAHRSNRRPWTVTVRLEDLPELVTKLYLTLASEP
jgi:Holliday junction resolvase